MSSYKDTLIKPSQVYIDDFPYISKFVPEEKVIDAFKRLRTFKPNEYNIAYKISNVKVPTLFNDTYLFIDARRNMYFDIDFIVDYYTEKARVKAKRFDTIISPYQYWVKYKRTIELKASNLLQSDKVVITEKELLNKMNSIVYENIRQVITMRPTIIKTVLEKFNHNSILDPFMGYGSSLIASLSLGSKYTGFDVNIMLKPLHSNIVNELSILRSSNNSEIDSPIIPSTDIQLRYEPFESSKIDETYDLVFTSPPFFDIEVYSNDCDQSIIRYNDKRVWYTKFLIPSLKKAWKCINPGGHMILYISNVFNLNKKRLEFDMTERVIKDLNLIEDCKFLGCIGYGDMIGTMYTRREQPLWVWKKCSDLSN